MAAVDRQAIARLKALGAATVHEAQGRRGALVAAIKPVDPHMRLAGPALTVDSAPADNLMLHYALTQAIPGDVLVVDAKGFLESGVWGDVMTCGALARGVAGLVIDGAVRDAQSIVEAGFPVFCRGLSIKGSGKRQAGLLNVPIICGGVAIRPGDILVGDRDGLVVVAAEEVEEVIRLSEEREHKEIEIRARLKKGESTFDMMNLAAVLGNTASKA